MFYTLLVLLVLDSILLITVVLLQAGKGGGLAAMGAAGAGSDTLFGSRQATTLLTRATWWTGGLFLVLAFALSILSSRASQPSSIIRQGLPAAAPTAAPVLPGIGDAPTTNEGVAPTTPVPPPGEAGQGEVPPGQ